MATRIERTAMPGPELNGKQIEGINARFENDGRTVGVSRDRQGRRGRKRSEVYDGLRHSR